MLRDKVTMLRRTWWDFGFTESQEKAWLNARVYNPMVAIAVSSCGITPTDIATSNIDKVYRLMPLGVMWQLCCNNNAPGEHLTSETGEMRKWKLEVPGKYARASR